SGPLRLITAGSLPAGRTVLSSRDGRRVARIPPTGLGYTSCPLSSLTSASASGPSIVGRSGVSARMTVVQGKAARPKAQANVTVDLMAVEPPVKASGADAS